jgi:ribosomal-protein-alanine N-acetyltransferase
VSWSIRPAVPADLPRIVALEQDAFATDRFNARQLRYLLTRARATFLVAESPDGPLGYAVALYRRGVPRARLYTVAVAEATRGKGIATALIQALRGAARARGCAALGLEVRADNRSALGLYGKLGFVPSGEIAAYYADGTAAIRMTLSIGAVSTTEG